MYNDPYVVQRKDGTFRIEAGKGKMSSCGTYVPRYAREGGEEKGRPIKYQTAEGAYQILVDHGFKKPLTENHGLYVSGGRVYRSSKEMAERIRNRETP